MTKATKTTKNEIFQLEEENRLMEERLRLMREMMVLEKQKREGSNSSTWSARMAKQNSIKKQEANKANTDKPPSQTSLSLSPSAKKITPKTSSTTTPKLSSSTSSTTPKLSSSTSSSPPTNTQIRNDQIGIGEGGFDEEASHQSFLGALEEWRRGGDSSKTNINSHTPANKITTSKKSLTSSTSSTATSSLSSSSSNSSLSTKPNMSKSYEGNGSGMAAGADFNEEESHQSFLDALEEWRNGGKPAETKRENARPSTAQSIGIATETSTPPPSETTLTLNGNTSWGAAISETITSIPSSSYFANM